jgi:hypothetical protein
MFLLAFRHAVIIAYLCITLGGLAFTLWRIEIPLLRTFARFSYQTMSPYQGYRTVHQDLVLEGRTATGEWETISVERYLPGRRGERFVRSGFLSFANRGDAALHAAYDRFALRVQHAEVAAGRSYATVQVYQEQWPISPDGIDALRMPPHVVRTLVGST